MRLKFHAYSIDVSSKQTREIVINQKENLVAPSEMHSDSDASLYVCATPTIFWSASETWSSCWLPVKVPEPRPLSIVPSRSTELLDTLMVGNPPETKKKDI